MTASTSFASDDWRSSSSDFTGETFRRNLRVVERLREFAAQRSLTLPTLAVAWTLSHPAVDVALVGARRATQLDGTVAASDTRLSPQDREALERILSEAAPVTGPSPEGM